MNDRILFQSPEPGEGVVVMTPSGVFSTFETARKDVPAGTPFIITTLDELPSYWSQEAWEVDFSNPDGFGIGSDAWFAEQEAKQ